MLQQAKTILRLKHTHTETIGRVKGESEIDIRLERCPTLRTRIVDRLFPPGNDHAIPSRVDERIEFRIVEDEPVVFADSVGPARHDIHGVLDSDATVP